MFRLRFGRSAGEDPVLAGLLEEMAEELRPEIDALRAGPPPRAWSLRNTIRMEARDRERGAVRAVWNGELAVRLAPRLAWHQRTEVASRRGEERGFDGKVWERGITGRFTHAYAVLRYDPVRFLAGRRSVAWGNGMGGSLILSGESPPLEGIAAEGRIGPVGFAAFAARLDEMPADSAGASARRYFSGHRISLALGDRARVGLSETVVYGGEERNPEWDYVNPLLVYYAVQWNRGRNDNVLWSVDGYLRVLDALDLYGELLIDDFQYDFETEPDQLGFLAGARLKRLPGAPGFFLDIEYVRVNNWVYGHEHPWNRYLYGGEILGHVVGPDADRTDLRLVHRRGRAWETEILWRYLREGEGSLEDPRESAVPFGSAFLGGEVRRLVLPAFRVGWCPAAGRRFSAGVERNRRKQWVAFFTAEVRFAAGGPFGG